MNRRDFIKGAVLLPMVACAPHLLKFDPSLQIAALHKYPYIAQPGHTDGDTHGPPPGFAENVQREMERMVPPRHQRNVDWYHIPALNTDKSDCLINNGYVGWKYTPKRVT